MKPSQNSKRGFRRNRYRMTLGAHAMHDSLMARFEAMLEDWIASFATTAPPYEMLRYHLGYTEPSPRRGKRLRPRALLQVAVSEMPPIDDGEPILHDALAAACAIELLHNYSLVHDDIEDSDELRHGRPTVWARYGVGHGINAGDAMCAVSYLSLLDPGRISDPSKAAAMAALLHQANLDMCWGQGFDLAFEHAPHVSYAEYVTMIEGKTAALFGAACGLGALAAGCGVERTRAYRDVGRAYGRAFQIRDDILGIWGDERNTGKVSGADIRRRKWSFPIAWTLSDAAPELQARVSAAYSKPAPLSEEDIRLVVASLEAAGARNAATSAVNVALAEAEKLCTDFALDANHGLRNVFTVSPQARA